MSYEEFDDILTNIVALEGNELDDYIDKRVKHLEDTTEIDNIGIIPDSDEIKEERENSIKFDANCCFIHKGYFSLNSRIYDSPNFYTEDGVFENLPGSNSLIVDTNDYIKEFCHYIKDKEVYDIETLFDELNKFINEIYLDNQSEIDSPEGINIIYQEADELGNNQNNYVEVMYKLSNYKGTNQKDKCKINSIIANNILNFFGLPFSICMGVNKDEYPVITNNNYEVKELDGEHAFNVLFGNDYCYLYDSTKTAFYMSEDKKHVLSAPFTGLIEFHSKKEDGKKALDAYFSGEENFLVTPIYSRPVYVIKDDTIEVLVYDDSYFIYSIGNNNDFALLKPKELFEDCHPKILFPEDPFDLENNLYDDIDNKERIIELNIEKVKEEDRIENNTELVYVKTN